VPRAVPGSAATVALETFERFPYGIVLVTREGEVLAYNPAARRLLGDHATRLDAPVRGALCELLGCESADGPLECLCLFERAADSHGPLPEVRVDLPRGAGAPAVWVTAAPFEPDGGSAIVELRPAVANDRRRRTTPHWTKGPKLRVYTLGRTRVESLEGPIDGRWIENRAGQVLKYLIAERHRVVYADEFLETLWADAGVKGLPGVRYFIHELRRRLEPERPRRVTSSFVMSRSGGYALDRRAVYVDADEFEQEITAGLAALDADDCARGTERIERGLALYGGDFLADEPYAEWAIPERDRLRRVAARGLRALVAVLLEEGDLDAATTRLERLGELEPYDIDVHRQLIGVALRRGRRTDAVRRYNALRRRMLTTFGEDLDFTLADVRAA
jgi:DNA-binding SARP family transcriptional activator